MKNKTKRIINQIVFYSVICFFVVALVICFTGFKGSPFTIRFKIISSFFFVVGAIVLSTVSFCIIRRDIKQKSYHYQENALPPVRKSSFTSILFFIMSILALLGISFYTWIVAEARLQSAKYGNRFDNLTIYAETLTQPDGWDKNWNPSNCPVIWGYKGG